EKVLRSQPADPAHAVTVDGLSSTATSSTSDQVLS
ncbi:undecaprenyl-phosphate 4-deoxy-4-formamido-L-arabinose transferase, partial [Pseudomonas sp. MWU13-2625]